MIERFRDPERAVAYLCLAMQEELTDADIDVTLYEKKSVRPQSSTVDGRHLALALDRVCGKFPEATAIYGMKVAGYPVGAIQCRCNKRHRSICPARCQHHDDRPIVSVLAFERDHPPSAEEHEEAVQVLRREIYRWKESGGGHVTRFYRG